MTTGPSSSQSPYLIALEPNVRFTSIATVGDVLDSISSFRLVGIPDGMGAFDNGDGTFTLLLNHELGNTQGIVRDHGSKGAFVTRMVIDTDTLAVVSADDQIKTVQLYDAAADSFVSGTTAFNRFCSADLAGVSAYFNAATGLGTSDRIFLTGEESGAEGRAFAIIASGSDNGTAYELGFLGNLSYENIVASSYAQDKTIVVGLDDSTGGQVYIYVGEKQATGNAIEKAGLVGGSLYGIKVAGFATETNGTAVTGTFTLQEQGVNGDVSDMTGAALQTESVNEQVTAWLRPEDGVFDPNNPNVFYFVTTASFGENSRLYKLTFADITNPLLGGTVEALLEGNEGHKMLDNMTIGSDGKLILQEDPGNQTHIAKTWQYDPATDTLTLIAQNDPNRFLLGGSEYRTQDEENSGVIEVTDILGYTGGKAFLVNTQSHQNLADPELVQDGQVSVMYVDTPVLNGTAGIDDLFGSAADETLTGLGGDDLLRAGSGKDVLIGGNGNDTLFGGAGFDILSGNNGDDVIHAGADNDRAFGGFGVDTLNGDAGNDRLEGGEGNDTLNGGLGDDALLGGEGNDVLNGGAGVDLLRGGVGSDTFLFALGDSTLAAADSVLDFSKLEGDLIDLSAIDAVAGGADDAFMVVNSFTNVAGQLTISGSADKFFRVAGDVDGDGAADFFLRVKSVEGLDAGDFLL